MGKNKWQNVNRRPYHDHIFIKQKKSGNFCRVPKKKSPVRLCIQEVSVMVVIITLNFFFFHFHLTYFSTKFIKTYFSTIMTSISMLDWVYLKNNQFFKITSQWNKQNPHFYCFMIKKKVLWRSNFAYEVSFLEAIVWRWSVILF